MTSVFLQTFVPVFLGGLCSALSTLSVAMVLLIPRVLRSNRRALAAEARVRELEASAARQAVEDRTVPSVRRVTGPLSGDAS